MLWDGNAVAVHSVRLVGMMMRRRIIMKLTTKPSCFGAMQAWDYQFVMICKSCHCQFIKECEKEAERAEEEYRYWHRIP